MIDFFPAWSPALERACAWVAFAGMAAAAQASTPPTAYTVYAAGDIAHCHWTEAKWSGAELTARVVETALAGDRNAVVLLLGDNVYQNGTAAEYQRCYEPTWGRFKARTYPAPGNREYNTPGASGYFGYFGAVAAQGYYSLQLGQWKVYSLDSNLKGEAEAAQLAWLKRELAASPQRCTLAYWHHPLYSSGGHGSVPKMQAVWDVLYAASAELVLAGHDHHYERFAPQDGAGRADPERGIRQFIVGTGGSFRTPLFLRALPTSEVRENSRTGVLKLVLGDGTYSWEFLEASYDGFPNGPQPDRGSGRCH